MGAKLCKHKGRCCIFYIYFKIITSIQGPRSKFSSGGDGGGGRGGVLLKKRRMREVIFFFLGGRGGMLVDFYSISLK